MISSFIMTSTDIPANPVNEALRKAVKGPPDLNQTISSLLQKTSRIHAAFLFEARNRELLQKLCLLLSSTRSSRYYNGWESFGSEIGLKTEQIKCIDFHFNTEDPAYYTLKVFSQRRDSTLDKIISALETIGRNDIILQTSDLVSQLVDDVITNNESVNNEDSGYSSLSSSFQSGEITTPVILPTFFPSVPLIFQEFNSTQILADIQTPNIAIEHERFQTHVPSTRRAKYAKKVMVTFAQDGEEVANKVAAVFRQERRNQQRIGVLILNDHLDKVNANPEQFIFSSFEQVDYVIPIITEGYLEAVSTKKAKSIGVGCNSYLECVDPHYVKYIYTLMVTYYMHQGCINEKVRCIVPDSMLHLTHNHVLMKSPLLQAWVTQSETEELSQRIYKSNV